MEYIIRKEDTLAIKGIAILMMLWHHLFSYYPLEAPFAYIIRTTAAMGNICVGLFLMVSAYGLTIQANNLHITKTIDYVRFIVKRIVKFLFSYWIIFFPSVLLGVVFGGYSLKDAYPTESFFLLDMFGVAGYSSYNVTWWFNQLIILMYVLFPIFYIAFNKSIPIGLFILGASFATSYFFVDYYKSILCFGTGMFIAFANNNRMFAFFDTKKKIAFFVVIGSIITLILRKVSWIPILGGLGIDCILIFFWMYPLTRLNDKGCFHKVFSFFGKHATNIYMIHSFFCYYFFRDFIYSFTNPLLIFFVLLIISLLISITIEYLKTITKYNIAVNKIIKNLNNYGLQNSTFQPELR